MSSLTLVSAGLTVSPDKSSMTRRRPAISTCLRFILPITEASSIVRPFGIAASSASSLESLAWAFARLGSWYGRDSISTCLACNSAIFARALRIATGVSVEAPADFAIASKASSERRRFLPATSKRIDGICFLCATGVDRIISAALSPIKAMFWGATSIWVAPMSVHNARSISRASLNAF